MVVGTLRVDLLLGDVHSLKEKRSVVRPIVAELRRRFEVAAAETGDADLHRRAELAVAAVASTHGHAAELLAACERLIAARPEIELLAARTRLLDDDDLD
ncbi:MAG: DUF503 domain-containing protein [bacterium]